MSQAFLSQFKSSLLLLLISVSSVWITFQARLPVRIAVDHGSDQYLSGFFSDVQQSDGYSGRWSTRDAAVSFPDFGYEGPLWVSVVAYAWRDATQVYTATVSVNGHAIGSIDRANWRAWRFPVYGSALPSNDDLVVGFHLDAGISTDDDALERGIAVQAVEIAPLVQMPASIGEWARLVAIPPLRPWISITLSVPALYLLSQLLGLRKRWAFYAGIALSVCFALVLAFARIDVGPRLTLIWIFMLGLVIPIIVFVPAAGKSLAASQSREPPQRRTRWATSKWDMLANAYIILFVVVGIATLPQYGITWDEGIGHLFYGERYFRYFTSFDPAYLDFNNSNLDIHQRPLNLFESPFHVPERAREFLPLANTLSAAAMELFAYRLGWLDPVDAFHMTKVLLSGILLWALYQFAKSRLGPLTAFLGILFLSTFPRFWGDMHFSPLDIPETVFFALTLIVFSIWFEDPSRSRAFGVGLLAGSALSIKGNALFMPVVLILGGLPWQLSHRPWARVLQHLQKYYDQYALMIATALILPFMIWPYVYADPSRMLEYYGYIFSQGERHGAGWNLDPLIQTLTTIPEVMLALLVVGLLVAITRLRSSEAPTLRLLIAWAIIPVLRNSLPGMVNFDGIRHFEEFVPAACLLAAFGGASLVDWASRGQPLRRWLWTTALVLLIAGNIVSIYSRYSPYEYTFYNSLVGGLAGANRDHGFTDATDYWGGSYRNGIRWLNSQAEPNAGIYVGIAEWLVRIPRQIWLRQDLSVLPGTSIKEWISSGRVLYVMFFTRSAYPADLSNDCKQETAPVHEIVVERLPILQIYRCPNPPSNLDENVE